MSVSFLLLVLLLSLFSSRLPAQEISEDPDLQPVHSMGLGSKTNYHWGPMFVIDDPKHGSSFGGQLYAGLIRDIFTPIFGVGIGTEAYGEVIENRDFGGGARAILSIKPIFLQYGYDYSFERKNGCSIWSFIFPVRRGGLFGRGSELRIDWFPSRGHTVDLGFRFYFGPRCRGITRPKHDRYHIPSTTVKTEPVPDNAFSPDLERTLSHLAHCAHWINRYTTPFFDQKEISDEKHGNGFVQNVKDLKDHMNLTDSLCPDGHILEAEVDIYHRMLERAFSESVAGDPAAGRMIADVARRSIFDDVIIPYNRLLGLGKKNNTLYGYGESAREKFTDWLDSSARLSEGQRSAAVRVFNRWLDILDENRAFALSGWKDSELVWLPLQYGLRPEQYATRETLNSIIERMVKQPLVEGNDAYYVIDERFQPEVSRMILQAEDYHVLWIHDYRGKNGAGDPDRVSFRQAMNYFQALTRAVERYDERGRMPLYFITIDQYFYSLMSGEYWLALLEDPLEFNRKLPKEYSKWSNELRTSREKLQAAVDESERLQAEAASYGKDWIKKTVKVHINITNPSDYAFRSPHVIGAIPFSPDELFRDHRKIVFYDVTEDDPGKGEAIFSGVGVGEQYVGPTWDDRSLLVQGPSLLSLKYRYLELLRQQGFREDEIPEPLREKEKPADYDRMVDALKKQGWVITSMNVHNQTGFRQKNVNVLKATLYNLMPAGATILVPDGLWNAPFWASMVAGASLRGCDVLIIGISPEQSSFFLESRSQEVFSRLIRFRQGLGEEIASAGGMLKTGIYDRKSPLGDAVGSWEEVSAGFEANPFLQELFPFRREVYDKVDEMVENSKKLGLTPVYYAEDARPRKPRLHLKINFLISEEVRPIMNLPGWETIVTEYWKYHEKFILQEDLNLEQDKYIDLKEISDEMNDAILTLLGRHWNSLSLEQREQILMYLTVGSHNHNYRSMISDGEVACLLEGYGSLIALLDLYTLSGFCVWLDDLKDLEPFLPEYSGFKRRFSRHIRKIM